MPDDPSKRHYQLIDILTGGGVDVLSDTELLTLAFGGHVRLKHAADRAREYTEELELGEPRSMEWLDHMEICTLEGIGEVKAASIIAAVELGRRSLRGAVRGERMASSADVYNTFRPAMLNERVEVFSCAMVDAKLRLIRTQLISRGTLTASIVHPRESFTPAIRSAASGVIFAHNHPSGDPVPSEEDRRITVKLAEVGELLGIPMLDHVIVGRDGSYYSFADAGDLGGPASGYRGMVLR